MTTDKPASSAPGDLLATLIAALDREIERARTIAAECDRILSSVYRDYERHVTEDV